MDATERPLFTLTDARQIAGVAPATTKRWLEGYSYDYRGERRHRGPRLGPHALRRDGVLMLSFLDLIEVRMAQELRRARVSWPEVDAAARFLRDHWQSQHPFALQRMRTYGRGAFAEVARKTGGTELQRIGSDQMVFDQLMDGALIDALDFREDGTPFQLWPKGRLDGVVVDPARSFGRPLLDASGVPVSVLVASYAANDNDAERVARWFDLPPQSVRAALRYAAAAGMIRAGTLPSERIAA